jgi:hypothetical protein
MRAVWAHICKSTVKEGAPIERHFAYQDILHLGTFGLNSGAYDARLCLARLPTATMTIHAVAA